MKIAVFGIGGVGGIVGGLLARDHAETYFYVRGDNLEAIKREGLKVQSVDRGNFTAHPKAASASAEELGPMDAVIVSCKGNALEAACRAITPLVRPDTVVIPLLNGVLVSELMESLLPPCQLADGCIRVFSRLEKPGLVIHSAGACSIVFGMRDGSMSPPLSDIAAVLNKAEVPTTVSDDILKESWSKYALMCGNSTVFCCYDGPVGTVLADPGHGAVLHSVALELKSVASAKGVTLPDEMPDRFARQFSKMPEDTMTSLYRDLRSGKPAGETELGHIIGRMVELGQETGVETPYHEQAYNRFINQGRL